MANSPKTPSAKLPGKAASTVKSAASARARRAANTELAQFLALLDTALLEPVGDKSGHKRFQEGARARLLGGLKAMGKDENWVKAAADQAEKVLAEHNKNIDSGLETKIFLI